MSAVQVLTPNDPLAESQEDPIFSTKDPAIEAARAVTTANDVLAYFLKYVVMPWSPRLMGQPPLRNRSAISNCKNALDKSSSNLKAAIVEVCGLYIYLLEQNNNIATLALNPLVKQLDLKDPESRIRYSAGNNKHYLHGSTRVGVEYPRTYLLGPLSPDQRALMYQEVLHTAAKYNNPASRLHIGHSI